MSGDRHIRSLAGLRTRLAMVRGAHVLLGAGCSCGLPAGHLDTAGADVMIGRHLAEKYRAGGRTDLGALLARVGESEGLSEALTAVIEGRHTLSEADAAALCEDLATALGSLEELTGGGRRTPRVETL